MSDDGFRYAFSHMLVAGTTLWCIFKTQKGQEWQWIYGTYAPLCIYSMVGVWRYGNPRYGDDAAKLYDDSSKIVMAMALPCFVTEMYIRYNYDLYFAIMHSAISAIPVGMLLAKGEWEEELDDAIVLGNVISGFTLSVIEENYFGIAATINYMINHFILKDREIAEVPTKVFYNAGLCFFLYYAYKALVEAQIVPSL